MDNPGVSTILTVGAGIAAILIAKKELETWKELGDHHKALNPRPNKTTVPNPGPPDIDTEDVDSSCPPKPWFPQEFILNNLQSQGANAALSWNANCASDCNTVADRFYCWLYNHQPNTQQSNEQFPPGLGTFDQFPKTYPHLNWTPDGYYGDNNVGYVPNGTVLWRGGAMPINPAFYMWYMEDAIKNFHIF